MFTKGRDCYTIQLAGASLQRQDSQNRVKRRFTYREMKVKRLMTTLVTSKINNINIKSTKLQSF